MNKSIEQISPETIALIESQAKLAGLSIDDYLKTLMPSGKGNEDLEDRPLHETATPQELANAISKWAKSHSSDAPAIPLESLRREDLY